MVQGADQHQLEYNYVGLAHHAQLTGWLKSWNLDSRLDCGLDYELPNSSEDNTTHAALPPVCGICSLDLQPVFTSTGKHGTKQRGQISHAYFPLTAACSGIVFSIECPTQAAEEEPGNEDLTQENVCIAVVLGDSVRA